MRIVAKQDLFLVKRSMKRLTGKQYCDNKLNVNMALTIIYAAIQMNGDPLFADISLSQKTRWRLDAHFCITNYMTEPADLTLEHLKRMRERLDSFRDEMMIFVAEQRMFNVHLGTLVQSDALTKAEVADIRKRLERIETRLNLNDA